MKNNGILPSSNSDVDVNLIILEILSLEKLQKEKNAEFKVYTR